MEFSFSKLGSDMYSGLQVWLVEHGVRVVIILMVLMLALKLTSMACRRIVEAASDHDETTSTERERRAATLSQVLRKMGRITLFLVAGIMIARELGLDVGPILAGAGVIGLAIGFGAQSLVKDFVSGFFMLIEDQVRVGDVVDAAGLKGQVERLTLRTLVLRDQSGTLHVIPNGHVTTLSNHTYGWSRAIIDVGVSYHEDIEKVFAVMRNVGTSLRKDPELGRSITGDLELLGLERFGESSVVIRALLKTEPLKQWDVEREFRRRLKDAFDAEGIEIPLPHQVVYHRVEEPLAVTATGEPRGRAGKYRWSVMDEPKNPQKP